ncbi:hypothetical protein N9933_00005, partial [bacterium]|nr:hypothetical protein [bacterium]
PDRIQVTKWRSKWFVCLRRGCSAFLFYRKDAMAQRGTQKYISPLAFSLRLCALAVKYYLCQRNHQ